jgi:glycine cleavage system regulatory protein
LSAGNGGPNIVAEGGTADTTDAIESQAGPLCPAWRTYDMNHLLVLTAIGEDRPGLVEAIARTVADQGGNWLDSRMSRLGNRFAGILMVSAPEAKLAGLREALLALDSQGLRVTVEESTEEKALKPRRSVRLELVGQDRIGIVREISEALARHQVSIDDLETEIHSASWSGESLCKIIAELRVPSDVDTDVLREILEGIANELMVDITLGDSAAGGRS